MFWRFWDRASFDARAIRRGRSHLRCALAAIVTAVSVIPFASLASVLPVQGHTIRASKSFFGPIGSASTIEEMIFSPQISSTFAFSSEAFANLVSDAATISENIGVILIP